MSLVLLSHMISHLKNCSRARLGTASIPSTKLHLLCSLALLRHGFISRVEVAGINPPPPLLSGMNTSLEEVEEIADMLLEEPWGAYTSIRSILGASSSPTPTSIPSLEPSEPPKNAPEYSAKSVSLAQTADSQLSSRSDILPPRNPAKRRIWLDLKYHANEPVFGFARMISKPTRRIDANLQDIQKIARGHRAGMIGGLMNPGDCMFFETKDMGVLEARECVERKIGGRALFRVGAPR